MDENDTSNQSCQQTENKLQCTICLKVLSRMQRLESHLNSVHGISQSWRYKLYRTDETIPIPRSTEHHLSKKQKVAVEECVQHEVTDSDYICFENVNGCDTDNDLPRQDSDHDSNAEDSENKTFSDYGDTNDGCLENTDCESGDEIPDTNDGEDIHNKFKSADTSVNKQFSSHNEKCLAILAFASKHRLTGSALSDMLKLLQLFDTERITQKDLDSVVGNIDIEVHDVCEKCGTLFPDDPETYECLTASCETLRYHGDTNDQVKHKSKYYFASLSVEQQLKEILSRPGIWQEIRTHRANDTNCFITDVKDADAYKRVVNLYAEAGVSLFTLSFNTDGAQLYSSSNVDLWPIFLVINELPPKLRFARTNMITWGLWQTRAKPNFQSFFIPLSKELIHLKLEGFCVAVGSEIMMCKALLVIGIMDLMAKAPLLCMSYHNGSYGCISCEEPGTVVKSGKGSARFYPPPPDHDSVPALRTVEGFLDTATRVVSTGVVEKGIKSVSPLLAIDCYDVVQGSVPDYMHGILLGVTKKLLTLWFASKFSKCEFSISKQVNKVESRLKRIKPNDYVQRMPDKLTCSLKASEYQVWLLYFALPSLHGILPEPYLSHFAKLVDSIYLMLSDKISEANLLNAENNLKTFYAEFPILYGKEHTGLNVHNLGAHLVWYVRLWGPLWAWSCFAYEDMNGNILNNVHGTGNVTIQALQALHVQKLLRNYCHNIQNVQIRTFIANMLLSTRRPKNLKPVNDCEIAGGLHHVLVEEDLLLKLKRLLKTDDLDGSNFLKATRIFSGGHVFYSCEYSRMKSRICHVVLIDSGHTSEVCSIQYFLLHTLTKSCYAVIKRLEIDSEQTFFTLGVSHIINVQEANLQNDVVPVSGIREKLMYITCSDSMTYISRMPNLYSLAV